MNLTDFDIVRRRRSFTKEQRKSLEVIQTLPKGKITGAKKVLFKSGKGDYFLYVNFTGFDLWFTLRKIK